MYIYMYTYKTLAACKHHATNFCSKNYYTYTYTNTHTLQYIANCCNILQHTGNMHSFSKFTCVRSTILPLASCEIPPLPPPLGQDLSRACVWVCMCVREREKERECVCVRSRPIPVRPGLFKSLCVCA